MPVLLIAFYAVTDSGNTVVNFSFTLQNFAKFFTDHDFLLILWRSLSIAFKTTIICILLGYPIAYFISQCKDRTRKYSCIINYTSNVDQYACKNIRLDWYLSDGGILQSLLNLLGFKSTQLLYTEGAVLLGMVYNFIPFMILQINTSLSKMDKSLLEASSDLGANRFQTFWKVTFPLSIPGVISGIALVFLPAVSSFFIPKLLGGGQYFLIGNVIRKSNLLL